MLNKNLNQLVDNMVKLDLQLNDLLKWVEIIDINDLEDDEVIKLTKSYRSAEIRIKRINKNIYDACIRLKDNGLDLFARAKQNKAKKSIFRI